jgi:hypothetical protein
MMNKIHSIAVIRKPDGPTNTIGSTYNIVKPNVKFSAIPSQIEHKIKSNILEIRRK